MNNSNDHDIIRQVLAGNTAAFAELVHRYKNMVFTLAYNITLNREDAEEVAQDAFVKAFAALRSFKGASKFATWLYRIVVNTALNKKKQRKFTVTGITVQDEEETHDAIPSLPGQFETGDRRKFIQMAMGALKEEERICITMFYLNELSVNEIYELTGISISNIKVLLHRGRKHLYTQLERLLKTEFKNLI